MEQSKGTALNARKFPRPSGTVIVDRDLEIEVIGKSNSETLETSFMSILYRVIGQNYNSIFGHLKKNALWLIPLFLIWIIVWPLKVMTLYSLPRPVASLISFVIFITATYNGFIGKAVFVSVISRNLIPFGKKAIAGQLPSVFRKYGQTIRMFSQLFSREKFNALGLFFFSSGVGLVISNVLTRNNKIDKYLVCLMLAFSIFDDISKGKGNVILQIFTAAVRDCRKFFNKNIKSGYTAGYTSALGFMAGLVFAFVPGQFSKSFVSYSGTVAGIIFISVGIILFIMEKSNGTKQK